MAPPQSETDRNLQRLEAEIRRLEIEYNSYFSGRLRTPPWDTRRRVDNMIKQFDRAYIPNYGERFRFLTLQTRAAKLSELWDRNMRAREEGRGGVGGARRPGAPPMTSTPAEPPGVAEPVSGDGPPERGEESAGRPSQPSRVPGSVPAPGVVHETAFKNPGAEREKLRGLYESLQQARDRVGERAQLPFDQFADLIQNQVAKLQGDGRSEVAFRVKVEDGRVKVTAKAIKNDGER